MDVKHINPVIESVSNIMPQLGFTDVSKKGVSVKDKNIESPGVVIIIGLIGDVKGNIIYGLSIDDAKKIASQMMMGMPVDDFNEMAQSAISELVNMLTANVATKIIQEITLTLIYQHQHLFRVHLLQMQALIRLSALKWI